MKAKFNFMPKGKEEIQYEFEINLPDGVAIMIDVGKKDQIVEVVEQHFSYL